MTGRWTVKDVMSHYEVCRVTVWRWVKMGCPTIRTVTGRMSFIPSEVEAWHRITWEKAEKSNQCNTNEQL